MNFLSLLLVDQDEAVSSETTRGMVGDCHCEAGGDRGVERVASVPKDLGACKRRERMFAGDNAMLEVSDSA